MEFGVEACGILRSEENEFSGGEGEECTERKM